MDIAQDFTTAQQSISAALVTTTRAANRISAEDVAFHRSFDTRIARALDDQNARLLALADKLLRRAATEQCPSLSNLEAVETHWPLVTDAVDTLLERCDTCLDEFKGRFRQPASNSQSDPNLRPRPVRKAQVFRPQNIAKPQLQFDLPPDNHAAPPFRPFLTNKPHAIVPLEHCLELRQDDEGVEHHQHPYEAEIQAYQFPSAVHREAALIPYKPFEGTTATFVDTYEGVLEMLEELKNASELAVDLEHHDTHTYIGLVSLLQISTRERDWIVDTLQPWRRRLSVLNEVFTDPNIVKVLHGAHMDTIWLQRDLGIYVVGLFDTHHASRVLGYAGGSLAFLLKKFIDFDAQKQYQTADWRLRPLPTEMFDYARSDTHFLLYIFDCVRNELSQRSNDDEDGDLVKKVLERSKETALQLYEHPSYDAEQGLGKGGWFNLIQRHMSPMSKEQFAVLRKVHEWRDKVARDEDEGIATVMPNHVLFNIARGLPRDMASLLNLSHPISAPIKLRTDELLSLVRETIASAPGGLDMVGILTQILHSRPALGRKAGFTPTLDLPSLPRSDVMQDGLGTDQAQNYKSAGSSFWGYTVQQGTINSQEPRMTVLSASLMSLPVPQYPSGAFRAAKQGEDLSTAEPIEIGRIIAEDTRSVTEAVQERPIKRKADGALQDPTVLDDVDATSAIQGIVAHDSEGLRLDEVQVISSDEVQRAEAKRARKAARKAHKTATVGDGTAIDEIDSATRAAFDYNAASSVMHVVPGGARKSGDKPFNPYAKAAEAPKGMSRKQASNATRSYTFKSS